MTPLHRTRLLGATALAGAFSLALVAAPAAAQSRSPELQGTGANTTPVGGNTNPNTGAQAPSNADDGGAAVSEVVVTGSRIRRPNLEANTPVSVVDQKEISLSGFVSVSDLLQRQPQLGVGVNATTNVNSIRNQGLELPSLRNLGSSRTLTLVNGRRQVGGGQGSTAVDTNTISKQTLARVDIVTGGNTATYGADAVAGVINFITRQDFEGVEFQTQFGGTEQGGGDSQFGAVTVGHNFLNNKANITATFAYNNQEGINRNQRDFALTYLAGVPTPNRISTQSQYAFTPLAGVLTNIYNGSFAPTIFNTVPGVTTSGQTTFNTAGTALVPFDRGTILPAANGAPGTTSLNCTQCFADNLSVLRSPQERKGGEVQAHWQFLEDRGPFRDLNVFFHGKMYETFSSTRSSTGTFANNALSIVSGGAANPLSGLPAAGGAYPIAIDNAFIPAAVRAQLATATTGLSTYTPVAGANNQIFPTGTRYLTVSRIDNDLPLRISTSTYTTYQTWAGINGHLKNDWHFEIFGSYGETDSRFTQIDRDQVRFFRSIDAVTNAAGQIVCRSTITNPGNGCTPLNIVGSGLASQQAINYSYRQIIEFDKLKQYDAQANLDGRLFSYPSLISGTSLPVEFAVGFEYRSEYSEAIPDPLVQQGRGFGNLNPITRGGYETKEVYAEVNVPLLRDVPFFQNLEVNAQARFQDYTTTGGDWSYSVNSGWQVTPDVKFRGGYSRAVRAPNVGELFAGGTQGFVAIADPCDRNNIGLGLFAANRARNCATLFSQLGIPLPFTQTPSTKSTQTTGNPNLTPEVADEFTGGIIFTPRFMRNLTLTLDYYSISIKDAIASPFSAATITANCVDAADLNNEFCARVTRDNTGNVANVVVQVQNVASFYAEGFDLGAAYRFNVSSLGLGDYGAITLNANASIVVDNLFQSVANDDTTRSQAAGIPSSPRFRGYGRATWEIGPFLFTYQPNYVGTTRGNNEAQRLDQSYNRIGEFWTHDLRAEYRYKNRGSVFVGVRNIGDENPPYNPLVYQGTGSNFYGDGLNGRYFYGGVNAKF